MLKKFNNSYQSNLIVNQRIKETNCLLHLMCVVSN